MNIEMFKRNPYKDPETSFYQSLREKIRIQSSPFKKKFMILVVLALAATMPWVVDQLHAFMRRHEHQLVLEGLPIEEKWAQVRNGSAHIKCEDDTEEILKNKGLNPGSTEGVNFALNNGLCNFVATENYTEPRQICADRGSWVNGECTPDFLPDWNKNRPAAR